MRSQHGVCGRRGESTVRSTATHRAAAALVYLLAMGSLFGDRAVAQDQQISSAPEKYSRNRNQWIDTRADWSRIGYAQDNRFATWTDSDGHFDYPLPNTVEDEAGGSGFAGQNHPHFTFCCVQAWKPGFLSDPDKEQGVEITLGGEPTVALIPEGLIKGRVSLPSSDAAFGIDIDLFSRQVQNGRDNIPFSRSRMDGSSIGPNPL